MKRDFKKLIIEPIAYIKTDFPTKFGIPRQGDLVSALPGKIIFTEKYRKEGILRELEGFSHLWLIWGFSSFAEEKEFSPTIRPPKLGGNKRVGVFASRSPNRPNPLGLTAVKIESISYNEKESPIIYVSGVDMLDNTPIYDIKPYLPFSDSIVDAKAGYTENTLQIPQLEVVVSEEQIQKIPIEKRKVLLSILANDPRPGFQHDSKRTYGFTYLNYEIKFHVVEDKKLIIDAIL